MDKKIYNKWYAMLNRCNSIYHYQTYKNVTVCDEWMEYENFKRWYLENIYDFNGVLELDKDLFSEDKKIYSPSTCCFLPKELNILISTAQSKNEFLPGVTVNTRKKSITYTATVRSGGKETVKTFKNQKDAFLFYKSHKDAEIKAAANRYKDVLPPKIYDKLVNFEVKATCEILEHAIKNKDFMRKSVYEEIIRNYTL